MSVGPGSIIVHIFVDPAGNLLFLLVIQFKVLDEPHPISPQMVIFVILQQYPFQELHLPIWCPSGLNDKPPKLPPLKVLNVLG